MNQFVGKQYPDVYMASRRANTTAWCSAEGHGPTLSGRPRDDTREPPRSWDVRMPRVLE